MLTWKMDKWMDGWVDEWIYRDNAMQEGNQKRNGSTAREFRKAL